VPIRHILTLNRINKNFKMAILNFRLDKIAGERNDKTAKNVEVISNFKIRSMSKEKNKKMGDYLKVNFEFGISYKPALGKIEMEGVLWYQDSNLDKTVKDKGKKFELEGNAVKEISTAIIRESLLESIDVSKKLRLPAPIRLPKVNVEPKQVEFLKAS